MRIERIFLILLLATSWACDEEDAITFEEAQAQVEAWAPSVDEEIVSRAGGGAVQKEIKAILEASVQSEAKHGDEKKPQFAKIAFDVYEAREFKPKMVQRGALTPAGVAVWEQLKDVSHHALDAKPYNLGEIEETIDALKTLTEDAPKEDFTPTAPEKEAVVVWLEGKSKTEYALDNTSYPKLTDQLLADAPRVQSGLDALNELGAELSSKSARLEALLAIDFSRLSRTAAYTDTRRVFLHQRPDDKYYELGTASKRPDDARGAMFGDHIWRQSRRAAERIVDRKTYLSKKVRDGMIAVFDAEDPKAEVKKHVYAPHPQYGKLVAAHKRYQAIVDAGGWKEVEPAKKLKKGAKNATVKALKERLKKEGFLPADLEPDESFDEKLETAIKDYQETHQYEGDGVPGKSFWKSVNVPASKRLRQVKVNLERMRRTNIRNPEDEIYVYVNIPDFHTEVWEKAERKMRFRIVVGNNDRVQDKETEEWSRANRTPVPLTAMIDRVIYNPYWVVTPRVRKNEILMDVKKDLEAKYAAMKEKAIKEGKDPSTLIFPYLNKETGEVDASTTIKGNVPGWYKANGYEVVGIGTSFEYVRMLPGRGNALGQVKVIFPNLHDVYLHDTNARALFKNPVRAYSHGCMRMQNPLDFAEYLLRRDELYEANDVPKLLKKQAPSPIFLKRKVPVFIEYYTTRVDKEERVHFLADPYDYDDKPLEALLTSGKE